ncbi:MAG: ATP-binding protein [Phenylobacterium sp.]|uniref:ATP-binding protein n=1 Tax=Phenylobacterium sp. TaxID=1871053 RepID=UPI0027255514|nr:ATP-binding protein [Phenylobacterium sp.]MDO8408480.1 ATP-binding protein [Phenylobacterium sp.]
MRGQSGRSARWVDVARFRKRDVRIILPLTLVAAAGSLVWLESVFVGVWLGVNIALQLLNQMLCRRILAHDAPGSRDEAALAGFTFIQTLGYGVLPFALLMIGQQNATVAAMAMIGAVALSGASELPASRRIAAAALAAIGGMAAGGLLFSPHDGSRAALTVALVAVACLFAYVLEAALHREAVEARLADALVQARTQERAAETANMAKSTFLATMSHEIRTPLNGVLGMAQVMAGDELSLAQRERLDVIRQSGEALTALLNNVLDLSKIEAGQMEVEAIAFDLAALVDSARSAFATLAADKGLDLNLEIAPSARGVFEGDPTRLRQVIYNLVANAVKFTDQGQITLGAEAGPQGVRIWVADTGPGLDEAQQARLFARFAQLDASTTRRHGGTGLGLAISQELCALMGGTLGVVSTPGSGSVFTLVLPLPRLAEAEPTAEVAQAAPDNKLGRLRVLAAEDNNVNQVVLRALLAPLGIEPVMVADGAAALAAWETGDWDLVLMDVRMPVMDGLTATREIRARELAQSRRRTPIIGLSADAMAHQVDELLAAGMDHHVSKPIDVTRLYGVLEAAL